MSRVERSGSAGGAGKVEAAGGEAKRKAGGTDEVSAVGAPSFVNALEGAAAAAGSAERAELDELLKRIDEQAKALLERPTMAEVVAFRDLVKDFVGRVVGGAYRIANVPSVHFNANQKIFIVAQKIDEALEALSREVLSGHATAVSLMARSDEIRGLLLDLRS